MADRESTTHSGLFPPALLAGHLREDSEDVDTQDEEVGEKTAWRSAPHQARKERTEGAYIMEPASRKKTMPGGYKTPMFSGADTSHRGNDGSSYYVPLHEGTEDYNDLGSGSWLERFFLGFVQFFRGFHVILQGCHMQSAVTIALFAVISVVLWVFEISFALGYSLSGVYGGSTATAIMTCSSPAVAILIVFARSVLQHFFTEFLGHPVARMVERRLSQTQDIGEGSCRGHLVHFLVFPIKTCAWALLVLFCMTLNIIPLVGTLVGLAFAVAVLAFVSTQSAVHCTGRLHMTTVFEQFETVIRNGWLSLGFGFACILASMIPLVELVYVPVAVAAGTQMYLQLEYYGRTVDGGNYYAQRMPLAGEHKARPKSDPRPFSVQIS